MYNGVDTLCDVDGHTNFQKYLKIIDNLLWTVVAAHFPSNYFFFKMTVGRVRAVKEFMEQKFSDNGNEWPAQSPDLNPRTFTRAFPAESKL